MNLRGSRSRWHNASLFGGAIALPLVVALLTLGLTAQPGEASGTRTLVGTEPDWALPTADHGAAAKKQAVSARIWLAGQDQRGMDTYARRVSDPRDALYRHYLSPAAFQQHFGPTRAQKRAVSSWASRVGLKVTAVTSHYIAVSGTVAEAEAAFSAPFHTYVLGGQRFRAPSRDARLPAAIASDVLTVTGLDGSEQAAQSSAALPAPPKNRWSPGPCGRFDGQRQATGLPSAYGRNVPWNVCGYTPEQLRSAYGATQPKLTGEGVTVAVVNAYASPTMSSDLARYSRDHDEPLRAGQYRQVLSPVWDETSVCNAPNWYTEEAKDVEAVHGTAPGAGIVYVGARDCTASALDDALLTVVDGRLADIVSCSWGRTADGYGALDREVADRTFEQGAIEGIGFYFSSGDSGYEDPATASGKNDGSARLQVDYPASDPWVTAVGGTTLAIGAAGAYEYETSWGGYQVPLAPGGATWSEQLPGRYPQFWTGGSGGGTSTTYRQPWYQRTVVPSSLSGTLPGGAHAAAPMREVPDVALDADPVTGMAVGETVTLPDGKRRAYEESRAGGTSLSCPLFAGIQALVQQEQGGAPVGFANPAIYLRYGTAAYHDVTDVSVQAHAMRRYTRQRDADGPVVTLLETSGRDGEGPAALRAGPGYDDATGVGSPGADYLESFG